MQSGPKANRGDGREQVDKVVKVEVRLDDESTVGMVFGNEA